MKKSFVFLNGLKSVLLWGNGLKSVLLLWVVMTASAAAQDCIRFALPASADMREISRIVSIDNVQGHMVTAYANARELKEFEGLGIAYEKVAVPQPKALKMATTVEQLKEWDRYPTYETYVEFMQQTAEEFPELCRLDTIGYSVQDRLILCMRIHPKEPVIDSAPEFFYSSTMHGDEVTGYYFMLRLIDTLLHGYADNAEIKQLVDWVDIYINPLSNPDGTYIRGNSSVSGSQRYNANYEDLNRNYPDPFGSDPREIEQENTYMMDYLSQHRFRVSANLHGGAEVMNYPWDSYTSSERLHPEVDWWKTVCKRYVDTARAVNSNLFKDVTTRGYINGGDWYVVSRGRQDYVNYEHDCLEMTMEISSTKLLGTDKLKNYWRYQHRSLINYIKETVRFGIQGEWMEPGTWVPPVDTAVRDAGVVITVNREGEEEPYPLIGTCFIYTITNYGEVPMEVDFTCYIKENGYNPWMEPPTIHLEPGESWSDQLCYHEDPNFMPPLSAGANTLVVSLADDDNPDNNHAEKTIYCTQAAVEGSHPAPESKISLYPNPAREEITVTSTGGAIERVEILDAGGRCLYTATALNTERFTYNVSSLSTGTYLARIATACGTQTLKFTVR